MTWTERDSKIAEAAKKIQGVASKGDAHFQLMEEDAAKLYNQWTSVNRDAAGVLARWGLSEMGLDVGDAVRAFMHAEAVLVTEDRNVLGQGQ